MIFSRNSLVFLIIILILLFVYLFYYEEIVTDLPYDLEKDGVHLYRQILSKEEIHKILDLSKKKQYKEIKSYLHQHDGLQRIIKSLGDAYVFQDYIWVIEKSAVHTCHRDNNGDFFNPNQKHPSYTMLIYLENMEKCLGVIPTSHKARDSYNINFDNNVVNLLCQRGDVILFNANLIHVGTLNEKDDHLRIQMKVSHTDDLDTLGYYQQFYKVLNKENTNPHFIRKMQKRFSCTLPFLSNLTQNENIRSARGSDNGVEIGIGQKIFSYLFYGNSGFYDLPNAF